MIEAIFPDDDAVEMNLALWAAARIWPDREDAWRDVAAVARVMAVFDEDELLAVMIYHNWDPKADTIEISGAAAHPRWLTRQTLWSLYAYPFDVLGCQLVVQRNAAGNARVNRILKKLGFYPVTIPRLRGRFEDEIIWTLTVENWRAGAHGKSFQQKLGSKAA